MTEIHKKSDFGWGTDAYPAQQPQELQFQNDRAQMAQMPSAISQTFSWVVSGKDILVVDPNKAERAYNALGITPDHHGPFAAGTVDISHRWTTAFVVEQANVDLDFLHKVFEKWAKYPVINFENWNHPLYVSSVQDKNGIPLPVKIRKQAADPGSGWQYVDKLWENTDDEDIRTDIQRRFPGLDDLEAYEGDMTDGYECRECNEVFDSYAEYLLHVGHDHPKADPTGLEEEIRDNDEFFYPDNEAVYAPDGGIHTGAAAEDRSPIGPIPFSYDIDADRIYVGQPGDERVEMDDSNPFGRAEGYYTPDRDLIIVNQSNIPYTIRHLMNLWANMHPEYEVKHVYIVQDNNGTEIREKVAKDV